MKRLFFTIAISLFLAIQVLGQCGGTILTVTNPSFEGPCQPHVTPPGWDICMPGVTPDTQPGSWGCTLPPSNGGSYMGLVYAPSIPWQEGVGQTLSSAMVAGMQYNFTIDLATMASADPATGIVLPPWCDQLQLWGGMSGVNSGCDQSELLWTSPIITNTTWVTYNLSFTPTQNWDHILFVIWAQPPACTDGQYLLMDNMSPIVPVADIAEFSATTVCAGTATQFTDSSSSISSVITNWSWDFGDGTPLSTQQNPTHTYGTPGTYNVTLTIITAYPCTTSVVHQVTVNPLPAVSIGANPTSLCSGQTATLSASGATTYNWSNGLGTSDMVNVNPTTTTTYTVTGSSLGCTGSASVTIPVSGLTATGNVLSNINCFNDSTGSADVSVVGTSPPYTYSWSPYGGNGQSASGLVAGTYIITVTDISGCQDTASVTISQPSQLIANITDSVHVVCHGASTGSATVSVSGGEPPYSYLWMPAGGTGTVASGIPAGAYQVTVTDDNGCTTWAQVTIQQPPEMSIIITPEYVTCSGACNGEASALASGGLSPYTYEWSTTPVTTGASVTNLCEGDYIVTVTDGNNCTATESVLIETTASIFAEFIAYPDSGVIPLNVQFTFTGSGANNYLWDFGDGNTSTLVSPSHTYPQTGSYLVTLIVTTGPPDYCADTFYFTIVAIQPSYIFVPNVFTPNNDGFNDLFQPEVVALDYLEAVIYNRWGRVVFEWNDPAGFWDGTHKEGGDCATGTYYYILKAKGIDKVEYDLHGTVTLLK